MTLARFGICPLRMSGRMMSSSIPFTPRTMTRGFAFGVEAFSWAESRIGSSKNSNAQNKAIFPGFMGHLKYLRKNILSRAVALRKGFSLRHVAIFAQRISPSASRLLFRRPQSLSFCLFARGICRAAQLLVFVRQESMRLAGIRLYRYGLFQVGQGLVESAV